MSPTSEPRNPLYFVLLLVSLAFVATALAYAVVPVLEDKAAEAGNPAPPSPFRETLRERGGTYLLIEAGTIVVFGLLSMAVDRLRALKKERAAGTMPPSPNLSSSPPDSVEPHADHRTAR
jgi:hypothetical protein